MVRRMPRSRSCTNSSSTAARTSEIPTWQMSDTTANTVLLRSAVQKIGSPNAVR